MSFKVPAFLADNPVESLVAVALLLGLLLISADGTSPNPASAVIQVATQKN